MSLKKSFIKARNSYKVTFKVPEQVNPEGKDIRILGEFNNWKWEDAPSLEPAKGTFKVDVELEAGKQYEYRYLVDNSYWVNDGFADAYSPTPYAFVENCVVILDTPEIETVKKVEKKATKTATVAKAKPVAKKVAKAPVAKSIEKAKPVAKKTVKAPVAKSIEKVDFTKVEGIGPKIATLLVEAGYKTYENLAAAKKADLLSVLEKAGKRFQMHDPSTWAKQSSMLAQGKLDALKKLQGELKGGKKV